MNRIDSEQLKRYFKKRPSKIFPIFLIAIGIFILLVGSADRHGLPFEFQIFAILFILIGFMMLVLVRGSKLTDIEIDQQYNDDIKAIEKYALDKLSLDKDHLEREDPLTLKGPILWKTSGVNYKDLLWKKGKDNIVRFSINHITVIYFSKNLLGCFACDFNFIKNVKLNETTDEYYYKDLVSVSTSETSSSYVLPNGTKLVNSKEFRLSLSSGEAIRVLIASGKLTDYTKGNIPTEEAERAVQVIRAILRDKKQ